MNNIFNPVRFWLLLKKTVYERPLQLAGFTLLPLFVVVVMYAFLKTVNGFEVAQTASFAIGLIGGGCFVASLAFGYFSSKAMGYSYLMLPCSVFEKWLCGVLLVVLYLAVFLLFFRITDALFITYFKQHLNPARANYKAVYNSVTLLLFDSGMGTSAIVMFLNFAGAVLVGSLYFNKAPFVKVALLIAGCWCAAFVLNLVIVKWLIPGAANGVPYLHVWINVGKDVARLDMPEQAEHLVKLFFTGVLPVILWSTAFIRLKEKEF